MTTVGPSDPAKDFAADLAGIEKPTRLEIERERHHLARLARQIHHAHSLGTRKENHIGSETFAGEDKARVVRALAFAAGHVHATNDKG